jgi:hypothetical protein
VPVEQRRRWARYVAGSLLQVALLVPVLIMPGTLTAALLILVAVLLFLSLGPVQAHIALSPDLDDAERARWRVLVATVPGAVAAYWVLYVR